MENNILELKSITKVFPGVTALDNVEFNLKYAEIHAIVGENGAGKSTLVKIITGVYGMTSGEIKYLGENIKWKNSMESQNKGISAIYQDPTIYPDLNVTENIFMGHQKISNVTRKINWRYLYKRTQELLNSLGVGDIINPKEIVRGLSIAERQIVEIAKALSMDSKILIMDEPTASLSQRESENLFNIIKKLKTDGKSVILISHKPEDIFTIADRVSVYRDGKYIGTKDVDKLNKEELISMIVGRKIEMLFPKVDVEIGEEVLRVEKLYKKGVFKDVTFSLHKGEILGIAGLVGSGRTEVVETIFGITNLDEGKVFIYGNEIKVRNPRRVMNLGLGFITENRALNGLILDMNIMENITLPILKEISNKGFIEYKKVLKIAEEQKVKLEIKSPNLYQLVKNLSGGNQQKVAIAKWLTSKPKILILDEPTKGIDVATKSAIHEIMSNLASQGMAIIMISSELPEILGMSDNIVIMHEGIVTGYLNRKEATQESIMNFALSSKTS